MTGEELGFGFVEGEHVAFLDDLGEVIFGDVDPEVHGVDEDKAGVVGLFEDVELKGGVNIAEEEVGGVAVGFGEVGGEVFEDVEFGGEGLAVVHVGFVYAGPAEGFACLGLEAFEVDIHLGPDVAVGLGKVGADNADHAGVGEEGGGCAGVTNGSAENLFAFFGGGFDGVDSDGADDGEVDGV